MTYAPQTRPVQNIDLGNKTKKKKLTKTADLGALGDLAIHGGAYGILAIGGRAMYEGMKHQLKKEKRQDDINKVLGKGKK
tara:strand:- start:1039 stop:1278 length:240 start_codon:yes stop_codon:yes gene_type:complete